MSRWVKLWSSFLQEGLLHRELIEQYLWRDVVVGGGTHQRSWMDGWMDGEGCGQAQG